MQTPDDLNDQFARPDRAEFDTGQGGLTRLNIAAPTGTARLYLHGAHLTSWIPAGQQEVLFLSEASRFAPDEPIRGGVPICFPWFGPRAGKLDGPAHGFARLREWSVRDIRCDDETVTVELSLAPDSYTAGLWDEPFELNMTFTIGEALTMDLTTYNRGQRQMCLTEALHTYFRVGDIREVAVTGLEGVTYADKVAGDRATQGGQPISFSAETDRVYLDTPATCELTDPKLGRKITVAKGGSLSTVVWNPWVDKARRMPDFGDEEWPYMACIETANALDNALAIAPADKHTLSTTITVAEL
jgi:glucose-6-phosphate 1-epimerase